jgi:serine/threonine protein kinase
VAIKFIQGIFKNEYDCVKILREICIQRQLSSMPNNLHVTELIDIFTPDLDINNKDFGIFIVMEYVDSDLRKMMT